MQGFQLGEHCGSKEILVSWKQICLPKEEEGLGFKSLRVSNKAYIWKLAWQQIANPEKLWVQVMRAKYNCGPYSLPQVNSRSICSSIWRAISGVWPAVVENVRWTKFGRMLQWNDSSRSSLFFLFPFMC